MNRFTTISLFTILILLSLFPSCNTGPAKVKSEPATIAQLLADPDEYNGKNVTVEGYLFSGWEWFFISEGYKLEQGQALRSTGGSIGFAWVDDREVRNKITDIMERLFVDSHAMPRSLFGKARVTGEFQLSGNAWENPRLAPIDIELLPWIPPESAAAPATQGELVLSEPPVLGKTIKAVYTFWVSENSGQNSANATVEFSIPDAYESTSGSRWWQGTVNRGDKVEVKVTLMAVTKGLSKITVKTTLAPAPGTIYSNVTEKSIYTLVLSDRGFFSQNRVDLPGESEFEPGLVPVAKIDDAVSVKLSMPHPPARGKTAEIMLVAIANFDAPQARLDIQFPESIKLVSGDLIWQGDMARGDRVELKVFIKATETGKFKISGGGYYMPTPEGSEPIPHYSLVLYIFEDGADTIDVPPYIEAE
jgi:hypothetical protein